MSFPPQLSGMVGERVGPGEATENERYIFPLSEVSRSDSNFVGNKAAVLGELIRLGFAVPNGYVLTTTALKSLARNVSSSEVDASGSENLAGIPADLDDAISEISLKLGDGLLAVRSSGVNEDMPNSSFAGQYETVLGVKGRTELVEAVKKCWSSQFSERAAKYGRNRSASPNDLAVLVQKLVRADSSGVVFTVNPMTGSKEVVVNAIRGLGDRFVSGNANPDEWIVGQKPVCIKRYEDAITEEQVVEVASLAKEVESHLGTPQDIEWAISGGKLFLLQARPITTPIEAVMDGAVEPIPIPIVVPEGYWTHGREFHPRPLSPMFASYGLEELNHWLRQLTIDVGLPFDGIEWRVIGGYTYGRIVPPGGKDRKPPPAWILGILVKILPSVRSRVKRMVDVVRSDVTGRYIEMWNKEWKAEILNESNKLLAVDLNSLTEVDLEAHLASVFAHSRRAKEIHFRYLAFTMMDIGTLAVDLQDHMSWNTFRVLDLLAGVSKKDSEPGRRLAELVKMVRENADLRTAVDEAIRKERPEGALSIDRMFSDLLGRYLQDYGHSALGYEVYDLTLVERPLELLRLIRSQMGTNYDPVATDVELGNRRAQAEAEIDNAGLPEAIRNQIKKELTRARIVYALHDEEAFYTQNLADGITRHSLLEVGRRLSAMGVLKDHTDVFMLTLEEAKEALFDGKDRNSLVRRRKGERLWAFANPGPSGYGTPPPPPPPLTAFPPEVQKLLRSMTWVLGGISIGKGTSVAGPLRGTPASSGNYEGPVRVIREESEFGKLQPGDVLVCSSFPPSWSVVFSAVGALVTEYGGPLSHPAIVAREYGVPAVLSIDGATQRLKDGQRVRVDGKNGSVMVLASKEESEAKPQ